jgi:signal transduction histidine kinase
MTSERAIRVSTGDAGDLRDPSEHQARRDDPATPDETGAVRTFASSITLRDDDAPALRAALNQAMDALRQRDELFALAAHELRTPLTPLLLHLQSVQRMLDDGQTPGAGAGARVARSLAIAEAQVKRLAHLVDELLDVARARAGRLDLDRRTTDLATIVREATARFALECVRRGTSLEVACPEEVLGRWDPLRLDQIVTNLVSNAVKHGEGAPIFVAVQADADRAILTVRDRGGGIGPDHAERIFEPFERGAPDRTASGAGLGLWIVRQLVEAHGGRIDVVRAIGGGAMFVVELPRG